MLVGIIGNVGLSFRAAVAISSPAPEAMVCVLETLSPPSCSVIDLLVVMPEPVLVVPRRPQARRAVIKITLNVWHSRIYSGSRLWCRSSWKPD